jgi:hypothetical protein
MGLKGYRLWAMGQLDSTCRAPPRPAARPGAAGAGRGTWTRCVAVQDAFERHILKPGIHLIGARVEKTTWVPGAAPFSYGSGGVNVRRGGPTGEALEAVDAEQRLELLVGDDPEVGLLHHSRGVSLD